MKPLTLYLCGVDWQQEIGHAPDVEGRMRFFTSMKKLKAAVSCWDECGILEVAVTPVKWRVKQDLFKNVRKKRTK